MEQIKPKPTAIPLWKRERGVKPFHPLIQKLPAVDDKQGNVNQFSLGIWALVACSFSFRETYFHVHMGNFNLIQWINKSRRRESRRRRRHEIGKRLQREGSGEYWRVIWIWMLLKWFMGIFKFKLFFIQYIWLNSFLSPNYSQMLPTFYQINYIFMFIPSSIYLLPLPPLSII